MRRYVFKLFGTYAALLIAGATIQSMLPASSARVFPGFADYIPDLSFPGEDQEEERESKPVQPILDSGPDRVYLEAFYKRLRDVELGEQEPARILYFGDSLTWGDNVTDHLKHLFQKDFGDGGRGLVGAYPLSATRLSAHQYESNASQFQRHTIPLEWFQIRPLADPGFTAESFQPRFPEARSIHAVPEDGTPWQSIHLILRAPERINDSYDVPITIEVSEGTSPRVISRSLLLEPGGCAHVSIQSDGARRAAITVGNDEIYIDGIAFETTRGVSLSSLTRMSMHLAWHSAIPLSVRRCGFQAYKPDLLIYQYGVNESASLEHNFRGFTEEKYEDQLHRYFQETRSILPDTPILIVGPYERWDVRANRPHAAHERVRQIQRDVARELRLAYFDSYLFFGGQGQMPGMVNQSMAMADHAHLTRVGGKHLAEGIYREIYNDYRFYFDQPADTLQGESPQIEDQGDAGNAIQFNSRAYIYFLIVVVLVGAALSRLPRARVIFLVLASYFFYATWMIWPLFLILASTAIDYLCALGIARSRTRDGRGSAYLVTSLTLNLGMLFFFKYFDFVVGALEDVARFAASFSEGRIGQNLPMDFDLPELGLMLPVGISFYTFQTLSYTIDVWRGVLKPERNILRFALYVGFFPQLVAGPIVRAKQFLPGLTDRVRHFRIYPYNFSSGIFLILSGLFKKMGADWLAVNLVDRVYSNPAMFTTTEVVAAVYAYGLQIYGDFSGYTDIALGSAALLGFRLTENFRRPYAAASISEFWRRWHISLGAWLRDYLYIPLGGSRQRAYWNLGVTMFLAGLWHGAGFNFVFWGLYYAAWLMIERATGIDRRLREGVSATKKALHIFLTLHVVLLGWIVFRIDDPAVYAALGRQLMALEFAAPNMDYAFVAAIAGGYLWHFTPLRWKPLLQRRFAALPVPVQAIAIAIATIGFYHLAVADVRPFIYFQF